MKKIITSKKNKEEKLQEEEESKLANDALSIINADISSSESQMAITSLLTLKTNSSYPPPNLIINTDLYDNNEDHDLHDELVKEGPSSSGKRKSNVQFETSPPLEISPSSLNSRQTWNSNNDRDVDSLKFSDSNSLFFGNSIATSAVTDSKHSSPSASNRRSMSLRSSPSSASESAQSPFQNTRGFGSSPQPPSTTMKSEDKVIIGNKKSTGKKKETATTKTIIVKAGKTVKPIAEKKSKGKKKDNKETVSIDIVDDNFGDDDAADDAVEMDVDDDVTIDNSNNNNLIKTSLPNVLEVNCSNVLNEIIGSHTTDLIRIDNDNHLKTWLEAESLRTGIFLKDAAKNMLNANGVMMKMVETVWANFFNPIEAAKNGLFNHYKDMCEQISVLFKSIILQVPEEDTSTIRNVGKTVRKYSNKQFKIATDDYISGKVIYDNYNNNNRSIIVQKLVNKCYDCSKDLVDFDLAAVAKKTLSFSMNTADSSTIPISDFEDTKRNLKIVNEYEYPDNSAMKFASNSVSQALMIPRIIDPVDNIKDFVLHVQNDSLVLGFSWKLQSDSTKNYIYSACMKNNMVALKRIMFECAEYTILKKLQSAWAKKSKIEKVFFKDFDQLLKYLTEETNAMDNPDTLDAFFCDISAAKYKSCKKWGGWFRSLIKLGMSDVMKDTDDDNPNTGGVIAAAKSIQINDEVEFVEEERWVKATVTSTANSSTLDPVSNTHEIVYNLTTASGKECTTTSKNIRPVALNHAGEHIALIKQHFQHVFEDVIFRYTLL